MSRIRTARAKRVRGTLPTLAGVAVVAAAVGAYAATGNHSRRAPLSLTARPARQTVSPGGTARYRITIHGRNLPAGMRLLVRGIPRYATAKIAFARHSHRRAVLKIFTSLRTPARLFRLRIRATHTSLRALLPVALAVHPPRPARFVISGNAVAPLWPGIAQPVDIAFVNPNRSPIQVTGLTVALRGLSAPRATAIHPCSVVDFMVQQFSGSYPIIVPPLSSHSLADTGIARPLWPQIEILDRSVDQDGCQGATITLSYTGTASRA